MNTTDIEVATVTAADAQAETRDLSNLARRINAAHSKMQNAMRAGLEHAIEAGALLIEAKAAVGHGGWLPWLDQNCTVSPRTAQAYMRVARNVPKLKAKSATVAHLTLRDALSKMASHATLIARLPAPATARALDQAETEPLHKTIFRAVEHERVLEMQRRQHQHQIVPIEGVVTVLPAGTPLPRPEPTPEQLEAKRLVECAARWIERALAEAHEHEPALSYDIILTALNEVYCDVQDRVEAERRKTPT